MVSTRGHKFKFMDGEKVLCYEPDPTKAKVLYDSKVLEVIVKKDERGRKSIEYLIHFQGWNSSWDRCVSEDHVLKDTDENRKLQRDLAEKAQLQLGAYLYRKDRKKSRSQRLSDKVNDCSEPVPISPRVRAISTTSCSSMKSQDLEDEEEESMSSDASSVDTDNSIDEKVQLDLSSEMKMFLEKDYYLINKDNKLIKIPAEPNILTILEGYLVHRATIALQVRDEAPTRRSRSSTSAGHSHSIGGSKTRDLDSVIDHLSLTQELIDGLRVYFDFTAEGLLLYESERKQFQNRNYFVCDQIKKEKIEIVEEDSQTQSQSATSIETVDLATVKMELDNETDRRRSLRSHRDPTQQDTNEEPAQSVSNGIDKLTIRNLRTLGHVSTVSGTSNHQSTISSSSNSSYYLAHAPALNLKAEKILKIASEWKIVPEPYKKQKPTPPSIIYGATHLARLFVKFPTLLYAANQPEKENQPRALPERKMKMLLHQLQQFLTYLEEHPEWFGEKHYYDNLSETVKSDLKVEC